MTDMTLAPRRRPLWPVSIAPVLVVLLAIAWTAFWFYAASQVDVQADAWRAREAKSGRVYDCARRSVAGYPFRREILIVAQVYDPKLVIAEFTAPATIADRGTGPFVVNWSKGRSSVVGLPA